MSRRGIKLSLLFLYFYFAVVVHGAPKSKPKPKPGGAPPKDDKFGVACIDDANRLCGESHGPLGADIFLCLESNHDSLSDKCSSYLGTTLIGGCDADAQKLCSQDTDITDIIDCLKTNKEQLSRACTQNLNNTHSNPWADIQSRSKSMTRAITAISLLYLLVPMFIAVWAIFKLRQLYILQSKVISSSSGSSGAGGMQDHADTDHLVPQCRISFNNLSYWAGGPGTSQAPKRLLKDVIGEFRPGTLTAVMGPSGSGKTTLLKLLGGQLKKGRFTGDRIINGATLSSSNYDKLLRNQAFVHQDDQHFGNLTVWTTLVYASILRCPPGKSFETQLERARFLMEDLGLAQSWDTVVRSLSGGQRRRLSIAVELCAAPSAIFLDEATSGLDATVSLKLVKFLKNLSRKESCAVVMTIHQPRAEIFSLFDSLLLLGVGGILIFSGPTASAARFLAASPKVTLNLGSYDNHGDFIIDVLGLSEEGSDDSLPSVLQDDPIANSAEPHESDRNDRDKDKDEQANGSRSESELGIEIEMVAIISGNVLPPLPSAAHSPRDGQLVEHLSRNFLESHIYRDLKASIDSGKREWPEPGARVRTASGTLADEDGGGSISSLAHRALSFLLSSRQRPSRAPEGYGPVSTRAPSRSELLELKIREPQSFMTKLWVLFGRRLQAHSASTSEMVQFFAQMIFITLVVAWAFSYKVDVELEKPYQIVLILFTVSTYAFILQYLIIPEYLNERKVILRERSGGVLSFGPYVLSALLSETPRAAMQSAFLMFVVYQVHPLNDAFINRLFCVVCLTVGVCAWQSLICVCSVVTDSISVAYSLCFLSLGCGGLFGGLLVRLSKIPPAFKWVYYTSVTAVAQRALVINDFTCCYLSATCNSIAKGIASAREEGPGPDDGPEEDGPMSMDDNRGETAGSRSSGGMIMGFPEAGDDQAGPPRGGPPGKSQMERGLGYQPAKTGIGGVIFQEGDRGQIMFQNSSVPINTFCPPGLQMTGDGSDSGNLGRVYLQALGLQQENPFVSLAFLFFANIALRFLAFAFLLLREKMGYKLRS